MLTQTNMALKNKYIHASGVQTGIISPFIYRKKLHCVSTYSDTVLRNFLKMLTYPLLYAKKLAKIKAENGKIVFLCWGYFIFECRFILKGHLSSCIVLTCTLPSSFKSNSHCCRLLIYFFAVSATQSLYRILFWDWLPSPYDFLWKTVHSVGTRV